MDAQLASFASVRQLEILEAIEAANGSIRGAARALKLDPKTVRHHLDRLKIKAASKGYSPEHGMTKTVPDGFNVRGVSTLYDADGKLAAQWVKSTADDARRAQLIREAYEAMAGDLPRLEPVPAPSLCHDSLCNLYTLTDSHVGALAWDRETQSGDWDLTIAERILTGCFEHMVNSSPLAKVAIVNQCGDFLHHDGSGGMMPVTPLHGNILDADGRFSKMVQTAIRILRRVIGYALIRHEKVIVLMAEGNHDMASSVWLRAMFQALYENEPRVTVIDSELPYYVYQHGKTMLAFHHGHLSKNGALPILFASQFPKLWGETTKRYAHTGHRHHAEEKEHSGITVTQHPTLAARDAYAARGGWVAERQVTSYTYHAEYGRVASNTITPEMLG
jgi:hypothetical protein